ncbi:MAG TPA: hypothetical protein VJY15_14600, partial [Candidatus Acidoferrum sp.]|nr:hypothetical protein [Candidatus Acidoferrum sp.]
MRFLGIENDYGTLSKDQNRDGFEQKLVSLLVKHLGKEFVSLVSTSLVAVDGKDICRIRVEPSPKPVYLDGEDGSAR